MEKEQLDDLYHLLRVASNTVEKTTIDLKTGFTPHEEVNILYGLCRHLLVGGDYDALIQFSQYYGMQFLLEPTYEAIKEKGWKPGRVVELGAGLGWLGRGLAAKLGFLPALFVDKRPWVLIDVVADLETNAGREEVLNQMKPGDLVVMSDFLHCVVSPEKILETFSQVPIAALEYLPVDPDYRDSYKTQLKRHGAVSLDYEFVEDMLASLVRKVDIVDMDPYVLMLIDAVEG